MASRAAGRARAIGDERFFFYGAIAMTLTVVLGFSTQLAMGRSSFSAPWQLHVHAVVFFAWTFFYLFQNALVATGNVALHRRLGWAAALLVPVMVALGIGLTVAMVRRGQQPFFFTPAYFLVMNPLSVLTFAGLATAAIRMRRRTEWHRRLMFCAMAMLLAPAFGRLVPLPLLIPYAGLAVFVALMLFPVAGMIADRRRSGRVHPAWLWGVVTMLSTQAVIELAGRTEAGAALTRRVTAGTPGAAFDPLAYPAPPGAPLITGR